MDVHTDERDTKHLIFLVDGTWVSAIGGKINNQSNIFRLNLLINTLDDNGKHQIVFYAPGVGTRGFIDRLLGGAFSQGIDHTIKELYLNICSNYWDKDKIYLFGYSRGAVVCRAVADIISKFGILRAEFIDKIPLVWAAFVNQKSDPAETERIRSFTRRNESIEFIGLFDAVLGRNYKRDNLFAELRIENTSLESCVKHAVHILSIDDNRRRFSPVIWPTCAPNQTMKQIWMPGVHSDIGGNGGCRTLSDIALLTMADQLDDKTELSLDDEIFEKIEQSIATSTDISISDERQSRLMKILARRNRSICEYEESHEEIHPIATLLAGKRFNIRGHPCLFDASSKFFRTPVSQHVTERQALYQALVDNMSEL